MNLPWCIGLRPSYAVAAYASFSPEGSSRPLGRFLGKTWTILHFPMTAAAVQAYQLMKANLLARVTPVGVSCGPNLLGRAPRGSWSRHEVTKTEHAKNTGLYK